MSTSLRLVAFVAGLAAVFGAALGVGRMVGPTADPVDAGHGGHEERAELVPASAEELPAGLQIAEQGYALDLRTPRADAGAAVPVEFAIIGPDGQAVTAYDVQHDKQLHLIAVRRDATGFQHVHPTLTDGTWRTTLDLSAGSWRLFADFAVTDGPALTLGADLEVDGRFTSAPVAAESRTAQVDDYEVTLAGDLTPGADAALTLTVSRDGRPVDDLEPYLGAYGHLVALRDGDLAYLHVHPDGEPGDGTTQPGPDVVFHTAVPSAGRYHLYLDFQHGGVVRTAHFTVTASDGGTDGGSEADTPSPSPTNDTHDDGGDSDHAH